MGFSAQRAASPEDILSFVGSQIDVSNKSSHDAWKAWLMSETGESGSIYDLENKWLESQGYSGTLIDKWQSFAVSQGLTSTIKNNIQQLFKQNLVLSIEEVYTKTLNLFGTLNNATNRQVFPAAQLSDETGSQVRITVKAGSSGTANLAKVYFGKLTGSYSFQSGFVQVTFNGGDASTGNISAGQEKVSDFVSFDFNGTLAHLCSFYSSVSSERAVGSPGSSLNSYEKSGDDAATQNASGYSSFGEVPIWVTKIEVR